MAGTLKLSNVAVIFFLPAVTSTLLLQHKCGFLFCCAASGKRSCNNYKLGLDLCEGVVFTSTNIFQLSEIRIIFVSVGKLTIYSSKRLFTIGFYVFSWTVISRRI